jgi:hypothetical protein
MPDTFELSTRHRGLRISMVGSIAAGAFSKSVDVLLTTIMAAPA